MSCIIDTSCDVLTFFHLKNVDGLGLKIKEKLLDQFTHKFAIIKVGEKDLSF